MSYDLDNWFCNWDETLTEDTATPVNNTVSGTSTTLAQANKIVNGNENTKSADDVELDQSSTKVADTLVISQPMPTEFTKLQNKLVSQGYATLIISASQPRLDSLVSKFTAFPAKTAIIVTNIEIAGGLDNIKSTFRNLSDQKNYKIIYIVNSLKADSEDKKNGLL